MTFKQAGQPAARWAEGWGGQPRVPGSPHEGSPGSVPTFPWESWLMAPFHRWNPQLPEVTQGRAAQGSWGRTTPCLSSEQRTALTQLGQDRQRYGHFKCLHRDTLRPPPGPAILPSLGK